MTPLWQRQETARILSAAVLSHGGASRWAAGTADGRVVIVGGDGNVVANAPMPGMVFGLTAVDLTGDGNDEIIAGSDVGGVRAFRADGQEIWKWTPPAWQPNPSWRQSMGKQRPVITDVVPIDLENDGTPELLAFGLYYYVLDARGKMICTYDTVGELSFTDLVGVKALGIWRTLETTLVLSAGDINGDGVPEIVGDLPDPGYRFIRAWDARTAKRLAAYPMPPSRYLGTAIKSVAAADVNGDGKDEILVGADRYINQLSLFALPKGLLWSRDLGGAVNVVVAADLDANGKPDVVAATEVGHVQAFDASGTRLFVTDLGGPVTSLLAVDAPAGPELWAGTLTGGLYVLDRNGRIIRKTHLPTYIDRLASDGTHVLATTAEGNMALFVVSAQ